MNRNEKDFDIDKEFSRQMQEAAYVYSKEKYRMTPEDDAFIKRLVSDRRKRKRRNVMKVAAVVVLTIGTGVSSVLWMNDDGVYGGRRVVDKCISVISDLDIAEEVDDDGLFGPSALNVGARCDEQTHRRRGVAACTFTPGLR